MIDKHQHHQNKVRNSLYFDQDTKRLIEEKSAELRLSQNKLTELCLQRYLPEMRMWLKSIGLSQQVWDQLQSIGRQKEASPLETLEMTLRNHFGLPVP